jgi:hypothetical protein
MGQHFLQFGHAVGAEKTAIMELGGDRVHVLSTSHLKDGFFRCQVASPEDNEPPFRGVRIDPRAEIVLVSPRVDSSRRH